MNILFITSSRIGDAVLSTGLLAYIERTWPAAKVTVVCGPLPASLFEGYPLLHRLIPLVKERQNAHWLKLWAQVVGTSWDMVIDLRNSAVSRLVLAHRRFIFGPHINQSLHKVEQAAAVMKLPLVPAPALWFTSEQKDRARAMMPDGGPILGVGPTSNWIGKTWPAERFSEVVAWMVGPGGPMEGARVAVFAAPGEEPVARQVLQSVPKDRALDLIAKGDPGTAAACLARCALYVGNDSGLMHCAAASGVPTFGLFGPSWPHLYRPWGAHCAYAQTPENFDELTAFEGYTAQSCGCLMESLSVEAVKTGLQNFLKRAPRAAA